MNCDRCEKQILNMDDLIFTAYATAGGHFCKPCYAIIEPEVEANFQRLKPAREAALASMKKEEEPLP